MLVQDAFEANAQRLPGKVALVARRQRYTYAQLDAMANRLAHGLLAGGVGRGDRVLIYLNNSVETVASIYATLKAGGVFVTVNRGTKRDKLAYIAGNCQAAAIISDERAAGEGVLEGLPPMRARILTGGAAPGCQSWAAIQQSHPDSRPPRVNIDLDLACLIYTSGSTGEPKGVMSDHSNVVFAAHSIITYLQNTEQDTVINALPLSFDYGLYQLLMTFTFGGTLVLEESFAFPAVILQRIQEERVTGFPIVPTAVAMLLGMDLSGFDLSSLRYVSNTAAALPPAHIAELRRRFPWVTMYSMYGLTETKRTLYLPPESLERKIASVGMAIPGTEVWLEDERGARLGPNQTGELVVRGRHVMRGYWGDPKLSAERFRPGPLPGERVCYTGDLFRMDEEGFLYFVGRKDDIIKSRGEKVAPKEVENVLYALKGIREAAVVGVADPILGQAVKAVVVVNGDSPTQAEILAHCKANLEAHMVPKVVEIRTQPLPKTSSGKIARKELA
jgi:amino acid adenylation domain-containing protein